MQTAEIKTVRLKDTQRDGQASTKGYILSNAKEFWLIKNSERVRHFCLSAAPSTAAHWTGSLGALGTCLLARKALPPVSGTDHTLTSFRPLLECLLLGKIFPVLSWVTPTLAFPILPALLCFPT